MKVNIQNMDRIIRFLIAIGISVYYFNSSPSGALSIILPIIAVVLIATSLVGYCPAYELFGCCNIKKK